MISVNHKRDRYREDNKVNQVFNKVRVGNIDEQVHKVLKSRFVSQSSPCFSRSSVHFYAKNQPNTGCNAIILNKLPGSLVIINTVNKLPKGRTLSKKKRKQKQEENLVTMLKL